MQVVLLGRIKIICYIVLNIIKPEAFFLFPHNFRVNMFKRKLCGMRAAPSVNPKVMLALWYFFFDTPLLTPALLSILGPLLTQG